MAMKAKHAFGALEGIDSAIASGKIDQYDILFVKNAEGKPYVGWVDKDGNKVVVSNDEDIAKLETALAAKANYEDVETLESQIATKVGTEELAEVEAAIATKADAEKVEDLEGQIATKVDADTVQTMIEKHSSSVIEVVEF